MTRAFSACTKMRDKDPSPPIVQDGRKCVVVPNTRIHGVPKATETLGTPFCYF
jgi:hypothetical protein